MQDIYARQLKDIDKISFDEFLIKKNKYSTRKSHDNINSIKNIQKTKLID